MAVVSSQIYNSDGILKEKKLPRRDISQILPVFILLCGSSFTIYKDFASYHSICTAPQVSPAPNPERISLSPLCSFP